MRNFIILIFGIILSISTSYCCINEYDERYHDHHHYFDFSSDLFDFNVSEIRNEVKNRLDDTSYYFEMIWESKDDSIYFLSDYAALLVYNNQIAKAKAIYHRIESQWPDQYTTASNLGTIYELLGMPDSALFWINKGYQLNPDSHDGSEWVHIKILEFKISGNTNTMGMFGIEYPEGKRPIYPDGMAPEEVAFALAHQLRERLYFIDAPNPILAQMFFDLAHCISEMGYHKSPLTLLNRAEEYGFPVDQLETPRAQFNQKLENHQLELRKREIEKQQSRERAREDMMKIITYSVIGLVLILITVIVLFRVFRKPPLNQD